MVEVPTTAEQTGVRAVFQPVAQTACLSYLVQWVSYGFLVSDVLNIPVIDAEGEHLAADSHLPTTVASG